MTGRTSRDFGPPPPYHFQNVDPVMASRPSQEVGSPSAYPFQNIDPVMTSRPSQEIGSLPYQFQNVEPVMTGRPLQQTGSLPLYPHPAQEGIPAQDFGLPPFGADSSVTSQPSFAMPVSGPEVPPVSPQATGSQPYTQTVAGPAAQPMSPQPVTGPITAPLQVNMTGSREIFRIAEELSQAVLLKSQNLAFNDNNLMKEEDVCLVQVDGITSDYFISEEGGRPYRMFDNISFSLNSGSCCVLISDVPLSAYVLARSICESADQNYENEPVMLAETHEGGAGQIMYIGSDSMLPDEMNCEEFLMYIQTNEQEVDEDVSREKLSVLLSQLGLSAHQGTDLRDLSYNKRILLIVLAAALNANIMCVVVNDPKFRIDAEEEMLARRIFAFVNNRGKCSLIACSSAHLMKSVANRVAVLKNGLLMFFDGYREFIDEYCLGILSFNTEDPSGVADLLERKHADLTVYCKEHLVYLMKKKNAQNLELEAVIKDILDIGVDSNSIVMEERSFMTACKEALSKS